MNKNSWKMRCVDNNNLNKIFTEGKIYEVKHGMVQRDCDSFTIGAYRDFNEWCETCKSTKWELVKDEDSFTKSDLKPFMLVKLRRGDLCIVSQSKLGVSFNSEFGFMPFDSYNDELLCFDDGEREEYYDVIEVYDISNKYYDANKLSTDNRELLFKREEQSQRDIKIKELQDKMDAIKREMEELK